MTEIKIIFSNQEPYFNLVDGLSVTLCSRGILTDAVMIETATLPTRNAAQAVLVMSNLNEAWHFAAALIGSGAILCNGDIRSCYLERRLWKTYITRTRPQCTPRWMSSASPAQLIQAWPKELFPAFLKSADASSGNVVKVVDQGDLADKLATTPLKGISSLLEAAADEPAVTVKVYSIGDQHRAFECIDDKPTRPISMDNGLSELSRLAQDASGLRILSFDCMMSGNQPPQIIDINRFPAFRAWPEAGQIIADYLAGTLNWTKTGLNSF